MLFKRLPQRGDTIIEVLIAIAVVSSVVVTAFAVVNRTTKNTRQAQEHSASLKLAESQIERLKLLAANPAPGPNDVFATSEPFCINDAGSVVLKSSASFATDCIQGENDQEVSISRLGDVFTARVVWSGPLYRNDPAGKDRVEIIYKAVDY